MTNLFYSDEELAQINKSINDYYSQKAEVVGVKPSHTIDLHCHGFTIEVHHDDNTLLCNGGFVFSDPDIAKVYIALGKHLEGVGK